MTKAISKRGDFLIKAVLLSFKHGQFTLAYSGILINMFYDRIHIEYKNVQKFGQCYEIPILVVPVPSFVFRNTKRFAQYSELRKW